MGVAKSTGNLPPAGAVRGAVEIPLGGVVTEKGLEVDRGLRRDCRWLRCLPACLTVLRGGRGEEDGNGSKKLKEILQKRKNIQSSQCGVR